MTLLWLELKRNFARRITRIVLILAVAGIAVNGVVQFVTHHDLAGTAPVVDRAVERSRAQCMEAQDPFAVPYESGGYSYSGPQEPSAPHTPERAVVCSRFEFGDFMRQMDPRFHLEKVRGGLLGFTVPLVMLAMILGASFIGAEWRANTVATQLVWEPRRTRVAIAKIGAAVITAVAIFFVLQALAAASVLPAAAFRGTMAVPDGWVGSTIGALLRGAGLVAVAAAAGHALGSAGRNTGAAIGFAFVYLMILEGGLIGNIWPGTRRWLVVGNSIVWVSGETSFDIAGRSVAMAGLVLLLYGALLALASVVLFRARDVT